MEHSLFLVDPDNADYAASGTGSPAPDRRIGDLRIGSWFILVASLFATIFGAYMWNQYGRLADEGVVTQGVVVQQKAGEKSRRWLTYAFEAGPPGPRTFVEDVPPSFYRRHPIGTRLAIRYLPEDPGRAAAEEIFWTEGIKGPGYATLFAMLSLAGILAINVGVLYFKSKEARLAKGVSVLAGEVLSAGARRNEYWIEYRFTPPGHPPVIAKYHYLMDERYSPPEPGTPMAIAFRDQKTFRPL